MADPTTTTYAYRLRAGNPMPISRTGGGADFVLHSFMAERTTQTVQTCTTSLPSSSSFVGQGGTYISAQFSRLPITGGQHFQGKIVSNLVYVSEDSYYLGGYNDYQEPAAPG